MEPTVLSVPPAKSVTFARNFVRSAVCELRFPTLLQIEPRALSDFQKAIRKEYPNYERQQNLSLGPGSVEGDITHVFRSKDGSWTIVLRNSILALESSRYRTFEDLLQRLDALLPPAVKLIDADFFTRVGLRYINAVPIDEHFHGWINDQLVGPLAAGVYGTVSKFVQEIRGNGIIGQYTFRHGFADDDKGDGKYVLDFDFFEATVEQAGVRELLAKLHDQSYAFFMWALGEKGREHLGPAKGKEQR